jgi:hypothetical protein
VAHRRVALSVVRTVTVALLYLTAGHAVAGVYKCTTASNGVMYQDTPCAPGNELRNLDKDPPTLSVVPGTATATVPQSTSPATGHAARASTASRAEVLEQHRLDRASERRFIRVGMTEAEVLSRIGRPEVNAGKKDKRGSGALLWSYLPNSADPGTITTVTIVGGKVTDVQRKIVR